MTVQVEAITALARIYDPLGYGGRTDLRFCVCVCKCFGLARVTTDFLFYPKQRSKSTGKTFKMFSWVRGVDYEKGRY